MILDITARAMRLILYVQIGQILLLVIFHKEDEGRPCQGQLCPKSYRNVRRTRYIREKCNKGMSASEHFILCFCRHSLWWTFVFAFLSDITCGGHIFCVFSGHILWQTQPTLAGHMYVVVYMYHNPLCPCMLCATPPNN